MWLDKLATESARNSGTVTTGQLAWLMQWWLMEPVG
jgi:hypothetical protein